MLTTKRSVAWRPNEKGESWSVDVEVEGDGGSDVGRSKGDAIPG